MSKSINSARTWPLKPIYATFFPVDLFHRHRHTRCQVPRVFNPEDRHFCAEKEPYAPHCYSAPRLSLLRIAASGGSRTPPRTFSRRSRLGSLSDLLLENGRAQFRPSGGLAALFPVRASEAGVQRNLHPGSILRNGAVGRRHVALPRFVG